MRTPIPAKSDTRVNRDCPSTLSASQISLLEKIRYQGNIWYLAQDENGVKGCIAASQTEKRDFRFQMALDKIHDLEGFINKSLDEGATLMSVNTYAPNPSNINPKRQKDKYGS